eukprot:Tamp_16129.p1 GENE.Tamp_16129~~Tamp_16129.p1  ORF type:complete len:259 (+),score=23.80 Tamp_16129:54-779(+)
MHLALVYDRMGLLRGRATLKETASLMTTVPHRAAGFGRMQVRGMAKGKKGKGSASKSNQSSMKNKAHEAGESELRAGVSKVVFECPSPMQFTALSSFALLQISGWIFMIGSNILGYSTGSTFIVSTGWCCFGLALSSAMATMAYWHARHHLVRLAVKPGLVDELMITTHTMIGGERTSTALRFDVVPNKLALQDGGKRHRHLMIRGHGNLILDSSGTTLDAVTLNRIMKGEAVLPSLLKAK